MNPIFDFNGDGKMDMLEFLIGSGTLNTNNPENSKRTDFYCDDSTEKVNDLHINEEDDF